MNKRIEELVKKHVEAWDESREQPSSLVRAALTELAAEHEAEVQALRDAVTAALDTDYEQLYREAVERIRQLEAERVPEGWQRVTVEPTEYEIQVACKALWESESHPMLTRAGYNTNFEFLPETILLGLRKKVRAIRTAMLAAAPKQAQTCQHRFMYFGTQELRRCADCNAVEAAPKQKEGE